MSDESPDRNGKSAKAMRLSRRNLMQVGLGVSAASLLLRGNTLPAFAAEHPALGDPCAPAPPDRASLSAA